MKPHQDAGTDSTHSTSTTTPSEFKLLTEEQLTACAVGSPFMVSEYRKLVDEYNDQSLGRQLAESVVNIALPRIVKLEAFISRLMWPTFTTTNLHNQLIDDAKNLGWDTKEWKK